MFLIKYFGSWGFFVMYATVTTVVSTLQSGDAVSGGQVKWVAGWQCGWLRVLLLLS